MIISASRRTDIPALYSDWLLNRLEEGYAFIPNPRNPNRLRRVMLSPDKVDGLVLWTKNPIPMLDKLDRLRAMGYSFYFQFTLTPYDETVACGLPPKAALLQAIAALVRQIGAGRVVWRYDPVIIDNRHSVAWHLARFSELCGILHQNTERCIFSF